MNESLPAPTAFRRFCRNRTALLSLALLAGMAFLAVAGPLLFHTDPHTVSSRTLSAPGAEHLFGTDINGRDLFARVLEGARISLLVGFCGACVSLGIGVVYGMVAGYAGGSTDGLMMRFVEILYAIPRLIIIILAIFAFDPILKQDVAGFHGGILVGYTRIIILVLALGLIEWLTMARIVRGQVLSLKSRQFIDAARSLGQSHTRIIFRHLLPNLIGIVLVYLTLTVPAVILDESFLSYLGLGVQPPEASWGTLLADGAQVINPVKSYWWLLLFPAVMMSLTLLAMNFLGDALRDLLDPRRTAGGK